MKRLQVIVKQGPRGWALIPLSQDTDTELLDVLYGEPYGMLSEDALYFEEGQSREDVLRLVQEVGQKRHIRVSVQGDLLLFTDERPVHFEHHVDLRWSLWSTDASSWEPTVLREMKRAYEQDNVITTLFTAPKKEIRYGTVVIARGQARVTFFTVWDSLADLLPDDCPAEAEEAFLDAMADYFSSTGFHDDDTPIGASVSRTVHADTFDDLMAQVDELEERLLKADQTAFDTFIQWMENELDSWQQQ